jgi:hypothetical protein
MKEGRPFTDFDGNFSSRVFYAGTVRIGKNANKVSNK